ncbi:mechanosensitive ion channel family protein [Chloroflexota bacterium]
MNKIHSLMKVVVIATILLLLMTTCTSEPATEAPTAEPDIAILETSVLETDNAAQAETTPVPETEGTTQEQDTSEDPAATEELIITPTPAPTATPGPLDNLVAEIAQTTGADRTYIFGLSVEDWINVILSVIIALVGILLISRLVLYILKRLVKSTSHDWVGEFLEEIATQIQWFVAVFFIQFATTRLGFLSVEVKEWLDRIYFTCYVILAGYILWKLIDFAIEGYQSHFAAQDKEPPPEAVLILVGRIARFSLIALGLMIVLDRFGVNVTGLTAALGIGGLALGLAAQDTLADAISGFTILLDQPFRVGDRIEIQGLDTWGDVVEIGTRTTKIRTRDNRMVIVPNSTIGKSQIVNYTYPDPRYRVQIDIGIGYGTDIEKVRQIIIDAVRGVEGILPDKPVDALYNEMGASSMTFRVRWWIESYEDTRRIYDRVNTALQKTLDEAGIDMPFATYDVNIKMDPNEGQDIPLQNDVE